MTEGHWELACCERQLLQEIADKSAKRIDVAKTYQMSMASSECDSVDWAKVNKAIMDRWSHHALVWIKQKAWSGKCWK